MNKTIRLVCLASVLLLLAAVGFFYVGDKQWQNEVRQAELFERAQGDFIISGDNSETNVWQITGLVLASISVALGGAGLMLWRHERRDRRLDDS
jgi:hypothetical protein